MKYLVKGFFTFFALLITLHITAQVKPVQFSFYGGRDAKGQAFIDIKAKLRDSIQLFSAIKKSPDDAFVSSIEFDSSSRKFIKGDLEEKGSLKSYKDAADGGKEIRFYTDSTIWHQPLNLKATDSGVVKGTITWLGKQGDNFPNGEEQFSYKIKAADLNPIKGMPERTLLATFLLCLLATTLFSFTSFTPG